jgi:hypothetical protein
MILVCSYIVLFMQRNQHLAHLRLRTVGCTIETGRRKTCLPGRIVRFHSVTRRCNSCLDPDMPRLPSDWVPVQEHAQVHWRTHSGPGHGPDPEILKSQNEAPYDQYNVRSSGARRPPQPTIQASRQFPLLSDEPFSSS